MVLSALNWSSTPSKGENASEDNRSRESAPTTKRGGQRATAILNSQRLQEAALARQHQLGRTTRSRAWLPGQLPSDKNVRHVYGTSEEAQLDSVAACLSGHYLREWSRTMQEKHMREQKEAERLANNHRRFLKMREENLKSTRLTKQRHSTVEGASESRQRAACFRMKQFDHASTKLVTHWTQDELAHQDAVRRRLV